MEKKEYIKYFELSTEDGPMYLYETYQENPDQQFSHEIPVTREFFTQEEGVRSFRSILFLDGKCRYDTGADHMNGMITEEYKRELAPYEFFEKVAPYVGSDEAMKQKTEEVRNAMEFKANLTQYRMIKTSRDTISPTFKNEVAGMVLKKYMKPIEKTTE